MTRRRSEPAAGETDEAYIRRSTRELSRQVRDLGHQAANRGALVAALALQDSTFVRTTLAAGFDPRASVRIVSGGPGRILVAAKDEAAVQQVLSSIKVGLLRPEGLVVDYELAPTAEQFAELDQPAWVHFRRLIEGNAPALPESQSTPTGGQNTE